MSWWKLVSAGAAYAILEVALRFKDDRDLARRLRARIRT